MKRTTALTAAGLLRGTAAGRMYELQTSRTSTASRRRDRRTHRTRRLRIVDGSASKGE